MSFQIHNPEGKAIDINELDKEAAAFWSKEPHGKWYASPDHEGVNWFDTIGWAIHKPENYTKGWDDIRCTLWAIQSKSLYDSLYLTEKFDAELESIRKYLKPYYELIYHWESKGYKPVTIKD